MRRFNFDRFVLGFSITLACIGMEHAFAADQAKAPSVSEVYFSQSSGTIEETYQGRSDQLVVCIQDAHANEVAQQNIARIVEALQEGYGMDLVGVEGSSGTVNTALFESFPGVKAKQLVSQFLFHQGKISGAELASVQAKKPLSLFGVEDPNLYLSNYDSFVKSTGARKDALEVVTFTEKHLSLAKEKLYPQPLRAWETTWDDFLAGKIPLAVAFRAVIEKAQEQGIVLSRYTSMTHYKDLSELEKTLDFAQVDKERAEAVSTVSKLLKVNELKSFTQMSLKYRSGKLPPLEFHRQLLKLLSKYQLAYPRITQYAEYLELSGMVDRKGLKQEMEVMADLIFAKIADRPAQEKIRSVAKRLRLADKFLRLRISRSDYQKYRLDPSVLNPNAITSTAEDLCRQAGVNFPSDSKKLGIWTAGNQKAQAFYEIALKRDGILATNLVTEMGKCGKPMAVLLAGGFHTDGILQYLKGREISYLVVLPNVGEKSSEERYLALLMRNKTPYLDVYRNSKKSDVLSGAIGWVVPELFREEAIALALTSMFKNLVAGFDNQRADFQDEYASMLLATLRAIGELQRAKVGKAWKEELKKRTVGIVDPHLIDEIKGDEDLLSQIPEVAQPLQISKDELYVPVRIGNAVYAYHFYRGAANADNVAATSIVQGPETIGLFTSQVMDVNGFAQALEVKAEGTAAKAVLADFGKMDSGVVRQTMAAMTPEIPSDNLPLKVPGQREPRLLGANGTIVYDTDKFKDRVDHLVGLSQEAFLLRQRYPNHKIVFVSNSPEVQKNLEVMGLRQGTHYDLLITSDQPDKLMDPLLSALAASDLTKNKPVVLVTPRPDAFGLRDTKTGMILDVPVIEPKLESDTTHVVSVRQILYLAQLVLQYRDNLDELFKLLAQEDGPYADLTQLLQENGIAIGDTVALRQALYHPAPIAVPEDAGKAFQLYSKFLESA